MIMDIEIHYKEFNRVIEKYNLSDEDKAEEIAHFLTCQKSKISNHAQKSQFLTNKNRDTISVKDFVNLFAMDEKDALIFLSYIEKGINFKRKHVDRK